MKCTEYQFEMLNMKEGQNFEILSVHCKQTWAANAPEGTQSQTCTFNPAISTFPVLKYYNQESKAIVFNQTWCPTYE